MRQPLNKQIAIHHYLLNHLFSNNNSKYPSANRSKTNATNETNQLLKICYKQFREHVSMYKAIRDKEVQKYQAKKDKEVQQYKAQAQQAISTASFLLKKMKKMNKMNSKGKVNV